VTPRAAPNVDGEPVTTARADEHAAAAVEIPGSLALMPDGSSPRKGGRPRFAVRLQMLEPPRAAGEGAVHETGDGVHPIIAALADGRMAVAWEDLGAGDRPRFVIRGQIFNADGSRWGPEFVLAAIWTGE
jgi:hypothetical protein